MRRDVADPLQKSVRRHVAWQALILSIRQDFHGMMLGERRYSTFARVRHPVAIGA
jgi:hypothetical protein